LTKEHQNGRLCHRRLKYLTIYYTCGFLFSFYK